MPITAQSIYEQTLVVRSQLGDEAACRELLELYSPRLLSFIRRMLAGSSESAEDLLQDVWIAIFRGITGLLDASKFRPWAFRIARDRTYREFRRRKLPMHYVHEPDLRHIAAEDDVIPTVKSEELHRFLNSLSGEHREVLMLRFFEEMDYEDIARVTYSAVGTVRSRIHYAKRALRHVIDHTPYEHRST